MASRLRINSPRVTGRPRGGDATSRRLRCSSVCRGNLGTGSDSSASRSPVSARTFSSSPVGYGGRTCCSRMLAFSATRTEAAKKVSLLSARSCSYTATGPTGQLWQGHAHPQLVEKAVHNSDHVHVPRVPGHAARQPPGGGGWPLCRRRWCPSCPSSTPRTRHAAAMLS